MGRVSTIRDQDVFGAIGDHMAVHGSITLQDIVTTTGVSIGSLYHRYDTREELLAKAWIDAVQAFQARFLAALESNAPDAGMRAAMVTPQFCRDEIKRAKILVCCRREELLSSSISDEISKQIRSINKASTNSLTRFAKNHRYSIEACKLGLIGYPLGAVRLYLPKQKVPEMLDEFVGRAFRSAVGE